MERHNADDLTSSEGLVRIQFNLSLSKWWYKRDSYQCFSSSATTLQGKM